MTKYVSGVLGIAAVVMSLGVAQFAVGRDLSGASADIAATAQSNLVNRSAKSDRPAGVAPISGGSTLTQLSALNDTTIVIRMPHRQFQQEGKLNGKGGRRPVACEAPASVLTDIAQQMASGRCVT